MKATTIKPQTIDDYLKGYPPVVRKKLQEIRQVIRKTAPAAEECISYQMPTFRLHGNLVHFAAWNDHIGFYPIPSGIKAFEKELSVYKQGKGSVQFPLNEPMPLKLIAKIVAYRVRENTLKAELKLKARKK
ncbi:MAG: DUF1801 domain-containing protein [Cyclobacteriaceae bacterium]|jgi:uncharacterized protein YdhG (YjbR/CyaY superfamily)|nr:DUF1801 domain-containing protein [Cyclobacteriaceae bacterium]